MLAFKAAAEKSLSLFGTRGVAVREHRNEKVIYLCILGYAGWYSQNKVSVVLVQTEGCYRTLREEALSCGEFFCDGPGSMC